MTVVVAVVLGAVGALMARPLVRAFASAASARWLTAVVGAAVSYVLVRSVDDVVVVVAHLVLAVALIALSDIDVRTRRLPREVSYPAAVIGSTLLVTNSVARGHGDRAIDTLIGVAVFTLAMVVLHVIGRGALGDGDVRMAPLLGAFLGFWSPRLVLVALLLGSLSAAVTGLVVIAVRRSGRSTTLPFGPFLALGTVVAIALRG